MSGRIFYSFFTNANSSWTTTTQTNQQPLTGKTIEEAINELIGITINFGPPPEPPMDPRLVDAIWNACAFLDIEPPLDGPDVIKRARKTMALKHHPDRGGDLETMKHINASADFLLSLR